MAIDLPPKPELWVPPKPAIIRAVTKDDAALVRAARRADRSSRKASFPMPVFLPKRSVLISFRSPATSTAATITAPNDIVAGDILVLWDFAEKSAASAVPPGFTNLAESLGSFYRAITSCKLADGTEAGASLAGMSASPVWKALVVFQAGASTLTPSTWNKETTGGNPTPQTVAASGGTAPLIILGSYAADAPVSERIFTVGGAPAKDGEVNVLVDAYLAWKIYNESPADAVIDMNDDSADNYLQSGFIAAA